MYLADIRREPKILGDIRVVLRWMVSEGDEPDAQVFLGLKAPRFIYVSAYLFDVLGCRGNVAPLAAGTVLHEHQIPAVAPFKQCMQAGEMGQHLQHFPVRVEVGIVLLLAEDRLVGLGARGAFEIHIQVHDAGCSSSSCSSSFRNQQISSLDDAVRTQEMRKIACFSLHEIEQAVRKESRCGHNKIRFLIIPNTC